MVLQEYTSEEVRLHNTKDDLWIIIEDKVYDLSKWKNKHPGGAAILLDFAGTDATDAFQSFHRKDLKNQKAYMDAFQIGYLNKPSEIPPVIKEYRALKADFEKRGLFKANLWWYFAQFVQLVFLEGLATYIAYYYKLESWANIMACAILLSTFHAQAGWLQHDFGHISVFESTKWNHYAHVFVISLLKGASSNWWQYRHNRHHAKPNILHKDPDLKNEPLFIFGSEMAKQGLGSIMTPFQTIYWFFLGPPMVTFIFFFLTNLAYVFRWGLYLDLVLGLSWLFRYAIVFTYVCDNAGWNVFVLYCAFRLMESNWFTWVTSLSHFPMTIKCDENENWVQNQLQSSQNFTAGAFPNWFSGHLNFQIEHHLFPQMPRHNYPVVAGEVQALLKKHDIPYRSRGFFQAAGDVVGALHDASKTYSEMKAQKKAERKTAAP